MYFCASIDCDTKTLYNCCIYFMLIHVTVTHITPFHMLQKPYLYIKCIMLRDTVVRLTAL